MTSTPPWLLRLAALVIGFAAVTVWRSHKVGIGLRDPGGQYLVAKIAISVVVFAVLVVVDAGARTPRPSWSARTLIDTIRRRWDPRRLMLAGAALLCYHLVYFCYHNLKSWDVLNAPRDAMLTAIDQWLFFGHTPALLLHDLLGENIAAWVLIVIYESFPTIVTVSFVAAVVLADEVRDGAVLVAAMCWAWMLGTASYYAVPSLGPFQDRPQDFAGLPTSIVTETQAKYMAQRAHLLADPGAHDAFAQVSAFASLHVAITTVLTLMAAYYGLRRTTIALSVYLAGTVVATIYLGWHFALDDLAGLAIGAIAVALGKLTIYPASIRSRDAVCVE